MLREEFDFKVDKLHLFGTLVKPENPGPHPAVIFIHGDGPINRDCNGMYIPLWERFIGRGYACMAWDKPGTGESKGEYDRFHLFQQRAEVVREGVRLLKKRGDIDPNSIGLWGISQAGWVMPLVAAGSEDVSFMIAVSCAGESGVRQSAILVRSHLILEGLPEEEAERYGELYIGRSKASTYGEYLEYARPLNEQRYIRDSLRWGKILPRDGFVPNPSDFCQLIDPVPYLERMSCPVLAMWGDKDTSIDVAQAVEAYRRALTKAGKSSFRLLVFPDTAHNMTRTETGRIEEWRREREAIPEFLDTMEEWLMNLRNV
jgi:dipeptidyl aminopeptidase/acylaminoacyl peptidase